ncbi:4-coumarate--CoA ligase-like 7 [Contarinia nasturtii]|uniref:4-coumarate--CoA ligase-like 7 n=1 Tax=Contarinia nasturtii TaxID=265458 RepID=UPI0012D45E12|nr:4-coumarate--CoA ligase-like 7 [Contarinia nasturtii]XP_031628672.1 4-coumarate--CoA ligase-like 7 [Contarinia nasturtii]XP_031628673.1 4-coumarate--CoA ligase-like 7 [Contarinia nasturtii]
MQYSTRFDANKKVWFGPSSDFKIDKQTNFGDILLENLNDTDAERVIQINGDTGETLTKAEVRKRTIRCAQNLIRLGCKQNDCISIISRNHHNLTPLLYAAICIGSPVSPLDVVTVKDGISLILQRVRPTFIFCDSDVLQTIKETTTDIGLNTKLFTVNGSLNGFDSIDSLMVETGTEDSFVCAKIADACLQTAVISCSSGSTGLPKSICMSHALFLNMFSNRISQFPFISLSFSSLYWLSGIWASISPAFKNTRIFTTKPFSAELFYELVVKHKIQFFFGPPCQMQAFLKSEQCAKADLSSLLACFIIGGFIPSVLVQTLKKFHPKCSMLTGYGMTEIGGGASCTAPNELEEYPNSVGRLVPGAKMKIISEKTGEKCGIGKEGEIYVKIPVPAIGYYKDETATRSAYDSEGYFISGDLGYFDESGRLIVVGRKKEIFKNCGFSIWPAELEDLIIKSPAIKEASVVSVYDDEAVTDLPAALVVKQDNCSITENEVYAIIADQLPSYKHLDGGVYFVDELPMTPSGKVIRYKVQKMAQKFYQQRKCGL